MKQTIIRGLLFIAALLFFAYIIGHTWQVSTLYALALTYCIEPMITEATNRP